MTKVSENRVMFGALNAFAGVFMFSVNDMAIKGLSDGYALHQVILFRSCIAMAFMLAFVVPFSGGWSALRTNRPMMHVLRGVLVVLSNFAFFMGLASLGLAETVAIFFVCPLIITMMSVVFLGEKVGPRRWASVAVGLAGVLIIVRPGSAAFQAASLLPLVAALCYAGLQIVTRRIGGTESAVTMTVTVQAAFITVSALSGLLLGQGQFAGQSDPSLEFFFRAWHWPLAADLPVFVVIGLASALGGYFISQAYRSADAALVASFEYASLPLALIWGLMIFAEWPGPRELGGMTLILGAGLFLLWREAQVRRAR
jgi:drug/metabolite transporter (DMT)-like permease